MQGADPVHLAGAPLTESRHVCAFFRSSADERGVLLPFVLEGLRSGDRAFQIVDPTHRDDFLISLAEAGVDVEYSRRTGQLVTRDWTEAYLRGGHFDQEAMLALIETELIQGKSAGFRLVRLVAHMEWALEDRPGVDDVVEYEARLNYILPRYPDPVV